mgnify:CR=1 FL=1
MSETTKLQVNFKTPGGTLINAYADTAAELEGLLAALRDFSAPISATEKALSHGSSVNNLIAEQLGGQVIQNSMVPPTAPAPSLSEGHCVHGKLVWRESKPGAEKAWKGWFCPSPKGTPDQCAPKFVR